MWSGRKALGVLFELIFPTIVLQPKGQQGHTGWLLAVPLALVGTFLVWVLGQFML